MNSLRVTLIVIHTNEPLGIYGAIDCGGYVSNFMLAAQALGLGTIPQAAAMDLPEEAEPLGKKAKANEDAKTAQVGTGWEDILPGGASARIQ